MADRPDARELLDIAQATLAGFAARADPADRYTLRMIAHAIGIAQREMGAGPASQDADVLWQRVEQCAADDVATQRELYDRLVALTHARLAVSNPRRLPRGPASR